MLVRGTTSRHPIGCPLSHSIAHGAAAGGCAIPALSHAHMSPPPLPLRPSGSYPVSHTPRASHEPARKPLASSGRPLLVPSTSPTARASDSLATTATTRTPSRCGATVARNTRRPRQRAIVVACACTAPQLAPLSAQATRWRVRSIHRDGYEQARPFPHRRQQMGAFRAAADR